jgi:hypothetical protein
MISENQIRTEAENEELAFALLYVSRAQTWAGVYLRGRVWGKG